MAEKKTLQQWLKLIDEADAPKELNAEFNRAFNTQGIQYPMKLFSIYILRREIEKGNLAAIRLEAAMKGTLKAEPEKEEGHSFTMIVPVETAEDMIEIQDISETYEEYRARRTPEENAEADRLREQCREIKKKYGAGTKVKYSIGRF